MFETSVTAPFPSKETSPLPFSAWTVQCLSVLTVRLSVNVRFVKVASSVTSRALGDVNCSDPTVAGDPSAPVTERLCAAVIVRIDPTLRNDVVPLAVIAASMVIRLKLIPVTPSAMVIEHVAASHGQYDGENDARSYVLLSIEQRTLSLETPGGQ